MKAIIILLMILSLQSAPCAASDAEGWIRSWKRCKSTEHCMDVSGRVMRIHAASGALRDVLDLMYRDCSKENGGSPRRLACEGLIEKRKWLIGADRRPLCDAIPPDICAAIREFLHQLPLLCVKYSQNDARTSIVRSVLRDFEEELRPYGDLCFDSYNEIITNASSCVSWHLKIAQVIIDKWELHRSSLPDWRRKLSEHESKLRELCVPFPSVDKPLTNNNPPAQGLCAAIEKGDLAQLRSLIAAGADINGDCDALGAFPLDQAAWTGNLPAATALVMAGADVNRHNGHGYTALHIITSRVQFNADMQASMYQIADLLLSKGLNPNLRYGDGETPIMRAAYFGDLELISLLLQHGADINARSTTGKTPLAVARGRGNLRLVSALLDLGAK